MNREIISAGAGGIYPLTGDVESQAGSQTVSVVGLQAVPIQQIPLNGGEVLAYNPNLHSWKPTLRATIQVDGVSVSDDYLITVDVPKPVLVNGA